MVWMGVIFPAEVASDSSIARADYIEANLIKISYNKAFSDWEVGTPLKITVYVYVKDINGRWTSLGELGDWSSLVNEGVSRLIPNPTIGTKLGYSGTYIASIGDSTSSGIKFKFFLQYSKPGWFVNDAKWLAEKTYTLSDTFNSIGQYTTQKSYSFKVMGGELSILYGYTITD